MKNQFKLSSLASFIDFKELGLTGDEEITRKTMLMSPMTSSEMTIKPDEERTLVAEVTNTGMDHDNEVIYTQGIDLSIFTKIPTIYWNHNYSVPPIGKGVELAPSMNKMLMKIKIADTEFAQEIWKLLQGGYLKACSIGFITKSKLVKGTKEFGDFVKEKNLSVSDKVQSIVKECILIENSIVGMPCNSDALVTAISSKSLKVSDEVMKELNLKDTDKVIELKELIKSIIEEYNKPKCDCPNCKDPACDGKCLKVAVVVKAACTCVGCDMTDCSCTGDTCDDPDCECNGDCSCGSANMPKDKAPVALEKAIVIEPPVVPVVPVIVMEQPKVFKVIRNGRNMEKDIKDRLDLLKGKVI